MGLLGTAIASDTIEDSFDLTLHRTKIAIGDIKLLKEIIRINHLFDNSHFSINHIQ